MKNEIIKQLVQIQEEHNCKILYAVEVGSRVWGYFSEDSDYDVRFIFKQPLHAYCSLNEPIQVIEQKTPLIEFHGWDLLKTLKLFQKSNPSLYEWLYSPTIYLEKSDCFLELRKLAESQYSLKKLGYHYLSLANSNLKKAEKTNKMYIQLIRALLMVDWILRKNHLPPLKIEQLLIDSGVNRTISEYLKLSIDLQKQQSSDVIDTRINTIIIEEIDKLMGEMASLQDKSISTSILNQIFWKQLNLV